MRAAIASWIACLSGSDNAAGTVTLTRNTPWISSIRSRSARKTAPASSRRWWRSMTWRNRPPYSSIPVFFASSAIAWLFASRGTLGASRKARSFGFASNARAIASPASRNFAKSYPFGAASTKARA